MTDNSSAVVYKFRNRVGPQDSYPIHQLQEDNGVTWIVIENDIVHDATNSYFEQIRQPDGSILLRFVDIFTDTKNKVTGNHHEAKDQDYME